VKGLEKLLMHYGCLTVVGHKLQISIELFIMEMGLSDQPFQLDYNRFHFLVTDCWLKSIWEKTSHFGFHLHLGIGSSSHLDGEMHGSWDCSVRLGLWRRSFLG
jgi:hypothetical protein